MQDQGEQPQIEDAHAQLAQAVALQQLPLQVAQATAIDRENRTVLRQALRLQPGFGRPAMATGELDAGDTQRGFQALQQIRVGLQCRQVLLQQTVQQCRPAHANNRGVDLEKLAHRIDSGVPPDRAYPSQIKTPHSRERRWRCTKNRTARRGYGKPAGITRLPDRP